MVRISTGLQPLAASASPAELQYAGSTFYYNDNNGNPVIKGAQSFSYDFENRLYLTNFGFLASYNGDGLRTTQTTTGVTTNYTWDVNLSLPTIIQDTNNTYVYGLDLISATDGSGNQTYYTYDGLGSTTDLTNGSATVTDQYSYDVFGAIRSHTGTSPNYWQFTGEQADSPNGLYYLRARYYDPSTGRFMTRDRYSGSSTRPLSQNPYAYGLNNPVGNLDPTGMQAIESGGLVLLCAGSAGTGCVVAVLAVSTIVVVGYCSTGDTCKRLAGGLSDIGEDIVSAVISAGGAVVSAGESVFTYGLGQIGVSGSRGDRRDIPQPDWVWEFYLQYLLRQPTETDPRLPPGLCNQFASESARYACWALVIAAFVTAGSAVVGPLLGEKEPPYAAPVLPYLG